MTRTLRLFALAALLLSAGTTGAVTLSFQQAEIAVAPFQTFRVDIGISGLGDGTSPSVGAFDLDVLYDPSQVSFLNGAVGTGLGDPDLFEAEVLAFQGADGTVDIAELSFLEPEELDSFQPEAFTLATLWFECLGPGLSSIGIDSDDLFFYVGDAEGGSLEMVLGDPVRVTQAPVPEPGTLLLIGSGLAGLGVWRRRKASQAEALSEGIADG